MQQVGEIVRDLGLEGQMNKQGTPTMGGLIILAAIYRSDPLIRRLMQHLHPNDAARDGLVGCHWFSR